MAAAAVVLIGENLGQVGDAVASGLVEMVAGLASAAVLFAYAWWAPLVLGGAWLATHWLLRDSGIWHERNTDEVREAQAIPYVGPGSDTADPSRRWAAAMGLRNRVLWARWR